MENRNPIDVARQVGKSLAGNIGETAFVELELAYASRLLPKFADDSAMRKNQNILLYWKCSYYKSTILRVFSQTIPADSGIVDISSMTPEKIFGSIDEKKRHIVQPAFSNTVKFVLASELSSLLGQRDFMRHFANLLNAVLEGDRVSRQTLKLGRAEINESELQKLKAEGISYDAAKGELSYTPNVCVFAASRPLDNKYFTYLEKNGHFSRYHVIQRSISDDVAQEHFKKDYKLDQEILARLSQINLGLSKVEIKRVLRPSEALLRPVYDEIIELAKDELADRRGISLADAITPRIKGDVIRESVAHAFLRTAVQNGYQGIGELQYTDEDLEFVLDRPRHFIEFALNPIIAPDVSKPQKSRKRERVKEAIVECLRDGTEKQVRELKSYVENKLAPTSISQATFYNSLTELINAGVVQKPRADFYMLVQGGDVS